MWVPGKYHVVKKGETLWALSRFYQVDVNTLARNNNIKNPNLIYPGQQILITTKRTKSQVAAQKEKRRTRIAAIKPLDFNWPLRGHIIEHFGSSGQRYNQGIDIRAAEGTPVQSIFSGLVTYSSDELKGYGNMIIIEHNTDFTSIYSHNQVNLVRNGDQVAKNQMIARVGRTGKTTEPKLHFELRFQGEPVNPLLYLPE